jgi:hypothetical protein
MVGGVPNHKRSKRDLKEDGDDGEASARDPRTPSGLPGLPGNPAAGKRWNPPMGAGRWTRDGMHASVRFDHHSAAFSGVDAVKGNEQQRDLRSGSRFLLGLPSRSLSDVTYQDPRAMIGEFLCTELMNRAPRARS